MASDVRMNASPPPLLAWLCVLFSLLICPYQAYSQPVNNHNQPGTIAQTDYGSIELAAPHLHVAPGAKFHVMLRHRIKDGWHVYWRNAGDSGDGTQIKWDLPDGFFAGEILYPEPQPYDIAGFTNYVFHKKAELLIPFEVSKSVPEGLYQLRAKVSWLVCADICVPADGETLLTIEVAQRNDVSFSPHFADILAAEEALPKSFETPISFSISGEELHLTLPQLNEQSEQLKSAYFFPLRNDLIEHAAEQELKQADSGAAPTLVLLLQPGAEIGTDPIKGLLKLGKRPAKWVEAIPGANTVPASPDKKMNKPTTLGLGTALLFAFLGGLILNLMPCVFPVLSLKIAHFIDASGRNARHMRAGGLFFALGIFAMFGMLFAVIAALRISGISVGWGFQLQDPWIVFALVALMMLIGLNLAGLFEMGTSLQNLGSARESGGHFGAFLTGLLAVIVASPCTVWFMAPAVGYTLLQPLTQTALVLAALAFGFALPMLLVSWLPGASRIMPGPGAWMQTAKQLLAFPMFATAAWLLWTLQALVGSDGLLLALFALILIALGAWAWGHGQKIFSGRWVWVIVAIASIASSFYLLRNLQAYALAEKMHKLTALK